jgi:phospholipid/cholesterol/gamma-HCH transport system ATP-binding protein
VANAPTDVGPRPVEVRLDDVHKSFDHLDVLSGVSLDVGRGEIVAVIGPSGCGKTVLLKHIIGELQPDRGRVLVADHETSGAPLTDLATLDSDDMDRLRVHWAVVFQRNALFTGTVYENIALWLREVRRLDPETINSRARAVLQAVDLDPDQVMERDRDELSGGMAKRVAVARALAMEPMLLMYDEPTTGLDPHQASRIHDLICETHREGQMRPVPRTTIIITHDKDLLHRLQPRTIMLHDGKVLFDGSYDRLRESDAPAIRPYFDIMPALQQRPMSY